MPPGWTKSKPARSRPHIWEVRALDRYKIDLSRLRAPVTLLFGKNDPITDADGVSALFSSLQKVTRETLEGGQLFFYDARGRWS